MFFVHSPHIYLIVFPNDDNCTDFSILFKIKLNLWSAKNYVYDVNVVYL